MTAVVASELALDSPLSLDEYVTTPAPASVPTPWLSEGARPGVRGTQPWPIERIAARTKHGFVFLGVDEILAFEASERLCFVHALRGRFDLDVTLSELERALEAVLLRVHPNWLVRLSGVRALEAEAGSWCVTIESSRERERVSLRVPVSKQLLPAVRHRLLAGAVGLRSRTTRL